MKKLADNWKELIKVVDKKGKFTGEYLNRKEASTKEGIYFNTVFAWIINRKTNELILEMRSRNKKYNPGKLGLVGGHVEGDDTIEETLYKEVNEEIGLDIKKNNLQYKFIGVSKPHGLYRSFVHNYLVLIDKDYNYKYQKEEVEEIVKYDFNKFMCDVKENPNLSSVTWERFKHIFTIIKKLLKL